ncbi:putative cyclin-D6-1 isoform X2 [Nicotiana tabacum]|uniref:Cyclin-D6-1 isoform X2 n=1 Tax=Nicotiana tabacum TaxID=4097 RepID=A0A1S3XA01_TOBAC|nr:putative cyclin-D6-1 isoform X2 [Nicotiana tomentosiformis]XP_016436741.1 PREDICTED: putative cyclin-D6-1 isoform X2 [Nicotiana tabacum]
MKFDLENPLSSSNEHENDTVSALFAAESDHMPSFFSFKSTDIPFFIRRHAFSLISQFSYNLDQFTTYLAVNYIDRFLSKQPVPGNKPWIVRILAIASLSLAAKMRSISLSLFDFQRDEGLIFDSQSIQRMEVLILTTLNWRLRSITPFAFLQFFESLFELSESSLSQILKDRATDIIFSSHYEVKLFEYKQSILAASALLCAAHELVPQQFSFFLDAVSKWEHINKDELLNCWELMRDVTDAGKSTIDEMSSISLTPKTVLDYEVTSPQNENNSKRRRLSGFRNDQTFHISQL